MISPQDFLQWVPAGATAVSVWFLIWILSDFKEFKKHTRDQIDALRKSQSDSLNKLKDRNYEMQLIVNEIKVVQNTYKEEVTRTLAQNKNYLVESLKVIHDLESKAKTINSDLISAQLKLKSFEGFLEKLGLFVKALKVKVFTLDEDYKSFKVKIGSHDLMIKKKDDK